MTDTVIVIGVAVCFAGGVACLWLAGRMMRARTTTPGKPAARRPAEVPAWPAEHPDADPSPVLERAAAPRRGDPDHRAYVWDLKEGPRPAGEDARP